MQENVLSEFAMVRIWGRSVMLQEKRFRRTNSFLMSIWITMQNSLSNAKVPKLKKSDCSEIRNVEENALNY